MLRAYGTRPSVRSLLRGEGLVEEANTVLGNGEAKDGSVHEGALVVGPARSHQPPSAPG